MKHNWFILLLACCVVTYLVGMFCVPLMDIDATQYASMSREMLRTGNYLQVYDLGNDYLDKPPMLFWLSSLSLRILGIHDWAYRLPSFLFSLLAIYSTYRLALLFYQKEIAWLSALVLAGCQGMFLINHDVRTDTMLMGWVMASVWLLAEWYQSKKWKYLLVAGVCIAGGMMTKGPLALMIPVFAFGPHFILRRDWHNFFRWEYIPLLLLIAALLVPMSIGLYQQFDLHPGKVVVGKKIDSGLRFFYWTQSFGRITGDNPQRENGSLFFQLQNMAWSFLPWIIFFLLGVYTSIRDIIRERFLLTNKQEAISLAGFLVTYLAIGSSKVQLPHYIFVAFPFAAIVTANYLYPLLTEHRDGRTANLLRLVHTSIFLLLWVALLALLIVPFKSVPLLVQILAVLAALGFIWLLWQRTLPLPKLLLICLYTSIGVNLFLNLGFYPALLRYQAGNMAAKAIESNRLPKEHVFVYGGITTARNSLFFYGDHLFRKTSDAAMLPAGSYAVTSAEDYVTLLQQKKAEIIFTGKAYNVSKLSLKFLNPARREAQLYTFYIVKIL